MTEYDKILDRLRDTPLQKLNEDSTEIPLGTAMPIILGVIDAYHNSSMIKFIRNLPYTIIKNNKNRLNSIEAIQQSIKDGNEKFEALDGFEKKYIKRFIDSFISYDVDEWSNITTFLDLVEKVDGIISKLNGDGSVPIHYGNGITKSPFQRKYFPRKDD